MIIYRLKLSGSVYTLFISESVDLRNILLKVFFQPMERSGEGLGKCRLSTKREEWRRIRYIFLNSFFFQIISIFPLQICFYYFKINLFSNVPGDKKAVGGGRCYDLKKKFWKLFLLSIFSQIFKFRGSERNHPDWGKTEERVVLELNTSIRINCCHVDNLYTIQLISIAIDILQLKSTAVEKKKKL